MPAYLSDLQAKLRLVSKRVEADISAKILRYLSQPTGRYAPFYAPDPEVVRSALQPGDILLVEGNTRLSAIIKYLTQSTWSHAALYVGERPGDVAPDGEPNVLLEAEADTGVVTVPLSKYVRYHTRICRPVGLDDAERQKVIDYALKRDRHAVRFSSASSIWRAICFLIRRCRCGFAAACCRSAPAIRPRAICSTLIAEAFASIHYPILPERVSINGKTYGVAPYVQSEIDHIRTYGLYTPRDFDVSPFFAIIKPTLAAGFDYRTVQWGPPGVAATDLANARIVSLPSS